MKVSDTTGFKDHFSGHAGDYARYRPAYPAALYDWLAAQSPGKNCAWDVATGNGQAATELAKRFRQVIATDGSKQQIAQARSAANIEYRVETAEHCSLSAASIDLITVAQSYHWFDHSAFVRQAQRVAKQDSLLAIWTYALAEINAEIDEVVRAFYAGPIDEFWPAERRLVEEGYQSLVFPWPEMMVPEFVLALNWSLADLLGYLRTWSAVQRFQQSRGQDPVTEWEADFAAAWGDHHTQSVTWPMRVRCFRITR
jgi:SAM-dependent methyltransferase